jgi:hypothetical protein
MRHDIIWMLALLGLTHLAAGAGAAGSTNGLLPAEPEAAVKGAAPAAEAPPTLDLRIVPRQPRLAPVKPIAPNAFPAERHDRFGPPQENAAEQGLSFGLEVRRRPQFERRALPNEEDAPGLRDDVERVIEHSTLGVRGTYRF